MFVSHLFTCRTWLCVAVGHTFVYSVMSYDEMGTAGLGKWERKLVKLVVVGFMERCQSINFHEVTLLFNKSLQLISMIQSKLFSNEFFKNKNKTVT